MSKKVHCRKCGSVMTKSGKRWYEGAFWKCKRFPNDPSHRKPWYHTNDMIMGSRG